MAIQKKYAKLGLAALAVSALIIGLSVGISQSNKNKSSTASLAESGGLEAGDFDNEYSCSSKSSKSSGSKSSKSSSYDADGDVTTTVAPVRRKLYVVPGTEDYERVNLGLGGKMKARRGELVERGSIVEICLF